MILGSLSIQMKLTIYVLLLMASKINMTDYNCDAGKICEYRLKKSNLLNQSLTIAYVQVCMYSVVFNLHYL